MIQNSAFLAFALACGSSAFAQGPCDTSARSETLLGGNVGALGVPTIEFDGSPVVGRPFGVWVENAAPNSVAFVAVSGFGAPVPLVDIGAISHLLPPYAALVQTAVDDAGRSGRAFDVADLGASFCGVELFVQGVVVDAAAPGWLAVTHARRFVIGQATEPRSLLLRASALGHLVNSVTVIRGDVDGDGASDVLALPAFAFAPLPISVLLSRGDGTFASPIVIAQPSTPTAAALGDIDSDGTLDLVTAYSLLNLVQVRLGNGDGTFGAPLDLSFGLGVTDVELGDVTGDSHVDIVCVNYGANSLGVFAGDGSGGFGSPIVHPTDAQPISVELGDFDTNGVTDVAVLAATAATIRIYRADGSGGLIADPSFATGSITPTLLEAIDFTGDGTLDFVVGGSATLGFAGVGDGTFNAISDPELALVDASLFLDSDDIDADGHPDLLFASSTQIGYRLVVPGVGLVASDTVHYGQAPEPLIPNESASFIAHDFDGDGFEDLVSSAGRVIFQKGHPASSLSTQADFDMGGGNIGSIIVVDVDQDGLAEVLTCSTSETFVRIANVHPLDDGSVQSVDMSRPVARFMCIDVDGDGRRDLVSTSASAPGSFDHHVVRLQVAPGVFAAPVVNQIKKSQSPVIGDVDGDAIPDVVVIPTGGPTEVRLGRADGTLAAPIASNHLPTSGSTLADANQDGAADYIARRRLPRPGRRDVRPRHRLDPASHLEHSIGSHERLRSRWDDGHRRRLIERVRPQVPGPSRTGRGAILGACEHVERRRDRSSHG